MRFIPNNEVMREVMLKEMGLTDIDTLFSSIPPEVRLNRDLNIPPGMAETEQLRYFADLAGRNTGAGMLSFMGGGSYSHFSPLVIDSLLQRAEFFTSYTPYQPEISQGTLQCIFEFQTFITSLTGMEVANASMYDGASATAEAVLMADRLARGRSRVLLSQGLHPHYRQVVETHTRFLDLELETVPVNPETGGTDEAALETLLDGEVACVVVQQPNFLGAIEDIAALSQQARQAGALTVVSVNEALSMALLETPAALGADIVAGEGQSFGVPVSYGGPYLGFMATREAHKRQLPGRIAGETVDEEGRRGYVLTLATREQHIRREKATSNICTNENLVMLSALFHLTLMGRHGLREAAIQNVSLLAYFLEGIAKLPGYEPAFSAPRFNEVTLTCPRPAARVVEACCERGVVPGLDLGRWPARPGEVAMENKLLAAFTETKTKADVDTLLAVLGEVGS